MLLQADGTIATTAVGAVLSRSDDGPEAGLEAAPCLVPSTSAWLPGIASGASDRTELVLSNPDDTEATVDLAFYGRNGRVAVPGSPGSDVPAAVEPFRLAVRADRRRGAAHRLRAGHDGPGRGGRAADPHRRRRPRRRRLGRSRGRTRHPASWSRPSRATTAAASSS